MAVAIILSGRRRRHVQPDQQRQPLDDRGQHRAAVPRVHRHRRQHPDRQRPGAVRHHARGQHARPLDRQPARRLLRSQLMSTDTQSAPDDRGAAAGPGPRPSAGCPRSAPLGLFLAGSPSGPRLSAVDRLRRRRRTVDLRRRPRHAGASTSASRAVEGRRKATDRLVTCLVTTAFGIAMVPLVSLVWRCSSRAWRGSTATSSPTPCPAWSARAAAPTTPSSAR